MSFMNIDELSAREVIAQYVLACRNKGLCLTYREYELIDVWLGACQGDTATLLLILDELLPTYFGTAADARIPKPLTRLHPTILRRLADAQPAGPSV